MSIGKTFSPSSAADPDLELVERAKEELPYRTHAYEELMLRHQKLILRICIKMLDCLESLDDVRSVSANLELADGLEID